MISRPRAALSALLLAFPMAARAESPSTLKRCFELAQARSELLGMRREDVIQSGARARSALGGALPKIDWEYSHLWQDPKGVDHLNSRGFTGFTEKRQAESRFTLLQPVFGGGKEFSAWSGLRRERARDSLRLARAGGELYAQTAEAFYWTLSEETELVNTQAALELAQDRVKELTNFLRLGKARPSEVSGAKSRAAGLRGTLRQVESRIRAAREELSRLTGDDLTASPLADDLAFPPPSMDLAEALTRVESRSDIRAQREDVAGRQWRERYERGSYWPVVDVAGNYYTKRATFLNEIKWDVRLGVRIPLYHGGSVAANVRTAESATRQSRLALDELVGRARTSIRTLHGDLAGAVDQTQALEEAAAAARESYDSLMKEYRLGLATNIEVIAALDALQTQNSARDASRYKAKVVYVRLGVATERLP